MKTTCSTCGRGAELGAHSLVVSLSAEGPNLMFDCNGCGEQEQVHFTFVDRVGFYKAHRFPSKSLLPQEPKDPKDPL